MKRLMRNELEQLLDTLSATYQLLVPQQLEDGSRLLRPWGEGDLSLSGAPVQRKPTEHFLPQHDPLLRIDGSGNVTLPAAPEKPLCLFGLYRADLECLAFVDRFCTTPPPDDAYLAKRQNALLIGLSGGCGPDGKQLPLADGLCDIELVAVENGWLAQAHSEAGAALLEPFQEVTSEAMAAIRRQSEEIVRQERSILEQAAQLVQLDRVPDLFWQEVADRCILCSGCNLVCPTCTCFCLEDRTGPAVTERSRVWDSCQFDGFMREASGHNPLGTEELRTRRRIHHKLAADPDRWGEISCFLCGRCDLVCPTGIGIRALATEIVKRYGSNKEVS